MGVVVLSSNYLVQFPINYFGLNEILTYGAFSYPIAFLITDLANRSFGKIIARKIVYFGFTIGLLFTLIFSTNFTDITPAAEFFDVYTPPITSRYGDVYWTMMPEIPLSKEIVSRFNNKGMQSQIIQ